MNQKIIKKIEIMNLKKALKEKNKLQGAINNLEKKIMKYNLVEESHPPLYDSKLLYDELKNLIVQLVNLKNKIP